MSNRKNFPSRKAARQESAAARQEAYDSLTHDEKVAKAKASGGTKVLDKLRKGEA